MNVGKENLSTARGWSYKNPSLRPFLLILKFYLCALGASKINNYSLQQQQTSLQKNNQYSPKLIVTCARIRL